MGYGEMARFKLLAGLSSTVSGTQTLCETRKSLSWGDAPLLSEALCSDFLLSEQLDHCQDRWTPWIKDLFGFVGMHPSLMSTILSALVGIVSLVVNT